METYSGHKQWSLKWICLFSNDIGHMLNLSAMTRRKSCKWHLGHCKRDCSTWYIPLNEAQVGRILLWWQRSLRLSAVVGVIGVSGYPPVLLWGFDIVKPEASFARTITAAGSDVTVMARDATHVCESLKIISLAPNRSKTKNTFVFDDKLWPR